MNNGGRPSAGGGGPRTSQASVAPGSWRRCVEVMAGLLSAARGRGVLTRRSSCRPFSRRELIDHGTRLVNGRVVNGRVVNGRVVNGRRHAAAGRGRCPARAGPPRPPRRPAGGGQPPPPAW